jgi:hypothetical protein
VRVICVLAMVVAIASAMPAHGSVGPTVSATADSVVVTSGDQALTIRLADGGLELKSPYRAYRFSASVLCGDGWAHPTRPLSAPAIDKRRDGVHVEIAYPVTGDRRLTIEADAYNGIPAVFVTSRLEETAGTRAEYYFWGWEGTFRHYYVSSPNGPVRKEVDLASKDSRLGYNDWFFLPADSGGLALFSKGDVGRGAGENGQPFLWAMIRSRALGLGECMEAGFGLAGVKDQDEAYRLWKLIAKRRVPALQRVPDVSRMAKLDYGKPAPEWLRDAETYNGFYKDPSDWNRKNISELLRRVPLVVGVPHDKSVIDLCHRAGIRVLPYVNYMELLNTKIEMEARGRLYQEWTTSVKHDALDLVNHPDWIAIDSKGNQTKSIWGSGNGHPGLFYTCFHQQALHKTALDQVRALMEMGADGVFIDNAGPVQDCFGDELGKHAHPDPSKTNTQMYEQLQKEIYALVKSFGEDRIVMHNSGIIASHWPYCDTQMWESAIYGRGVREPMDTWEEARYRGEEIAEARRHGKVPVIIAYLNGQPADRRVDSALYSYAYARLYGMLWADWFNLDDSAANRDTARALYSLRIGQPTSPIKQQSHVFLRYFERGVALLNPTKSEQPVTVPLPAGAVVHDIGHPELTVPADGRLTINTAPQTGRVLYW